MTPAARERLQVQAPMLMVSAAAWALLVLEPGGASLSAHCATALRGANWPVSLASGWALMLVAMMAPLLASPVRHVRDRSFARRRTRAITLFLGAYATIWMAAGVILTQLSLAVRLIGPDSLAPLAMAAIAALIWQSSPVKQHCLNRGHKHPELAAFGPAADSDALRFGLTHGLWCAGSCWALMLLPLLVTRGHIAAMAAVTLWIVGERLERPQAPGWGLRFPGKAARLTAAQIGMRLGVFQRGRTAKKRELALNFPSPP